MVRGPGLGLIVALVVAACVSAPEVPRAADGALLPAVVELEGDVRLRPEEPVVLGTVSWIGDPEAQRRYRGWLGDDGETCVDWVGGDTVCFPGDEGGQHGGMDPEWCAHLALPERTARAVIETADGLRLEMTRLVQPPQGANVFVACWLGTDTRWLEYHDETGALIRRHRF